jgi:K(+)-stimulated pyrophosphate-energized sodium pump
MMLLPPISALISIAAGIILFIYIRKQDMGTKKMKEITLAIKEGANAFLKREFTVLTYFVFIMAIALSLFIYPLMGPTYVFGAVCSGIKLSLLLFAEAL